jgi:hypothetical protein
LAIQISQYARHRAGAASFPRSDCESGCLLTRLRHSTIGSHRGRAVGPVFDPHRHDRGSSGRYESLLMSWEWSSGQTGRSRPRRPPRRPSRRSRSLPRALAVAIEKQADQLDFRCCRACSRRPRPPSTSATSAASPRTAIKYPAPAPAKPAPSLPGGLRRAYARATPDPCRGSRAARARSRRARSSSACRIPSARSSPTTTVRRGRPRLRRLRACIEV